jgi:hypothetical protein
MPGKKNWFDTQRPLLIHPLWLLLAWAAVQTVLLYRYGIGTQLEAAKYIDEARHLLKTGRLSASKYWLYSTQIFLIAGAIKLKLGLVAVYLVQLLLNALSTYCLYRFIKNLSNPAVAFFISLVYIFIIPVQLFNCILQTESIFFSITLIFSCYLLQLKKIGLYAWLKILALLLLILFTRPTGLLFFPGTLLYVFFRFFPAFSFLQKILMTGAAVIFFIFFLNSSLGAGGGFDFMYPFQTEMIICGVPGTNEVMPIDMMEQPNSIAGLLYYITHNTEQFLRLSWYKTLAFFGVAREYYSPAHNLLLRLIVFPFYILALFSLRWWWKNKRGMLAYCLTFIAITWLSVIVSCDDWHNRFLFTLVPYIYILSVPAITRIGRKILNNKSPRANDHA